MNYNNIFLVYWNTMIDMYIESLEHVKKVWNESNRT